MSAAKTSTAAASAVKSIAGNTTSGSSLVKPSVQISNFISETAKKTFFSSDIGFIIFFIGIFLVVGLGMVILFENGVPQMRTQLLANFVGLALAVAFIIFVFKQMGKQFEVFGHKFDVGMLYYIGILFVVMILFTG